MDLLETEYLILREFIAERIAVAKFGVNDRGSNGTGSRPTRLPYQFSRALRTKANHFQRGGADVSCTARHCATLSVA